MLANSETLLQRASRYELGLCELVNRTCRWPCVEQFFAVISRLGDGVFWYTLMVALPVVYGIEALVVSLVMGLTAIFGLLCYKLLKQGTSRPRPYALNHRIKLGTAPLDQFSFPSGHTLHAVAFTITASYAYPELGWLLIPFTLLVALSRVVLGLHYPSDVLAGASLGAAFAIVALNAL